MKYFYLAEEIARQAVGSRKKDRLRIRTWQAIAAVLLVLHVVMAILRYG